MPEDKDQAASGGNVESSGQSNQDDQTVSGSYPKDFVEKLKKEKLSARAEAEALKKQLADKEASELEKSGKLNELVELERKRAKELEEKNSTLSNAIIKKAVLSAARAEAEKNGALYFEAIENLLDPSKVEVNPETLDVDTSAITNQITALKAKMPALFRTVAPRTVDMPPSGDPGKQQPKKSLAEMSNDELKELLKKSYNK